MPTLPKEHALGQDEPVEEQGLEEGDEPRAREEALQQVARRQDEGEG
ncbi:MAG: hypothetical protein ACLFU8_17965 [Anaerolineales bacterium]